MAMGAEQSATHIASEGKSADIGMSFVETLDERIAADTGAGVQSVTECGAQQGQQVLQTWVNEVEQKMERESGATSKNAVQRFDSTSHVAPMPMTKHSGETQTSKATCTAPTTDGRSEDVDSVAKTSTTQSAISFVQAASSTAEQASDAMIDFVSGADAMQQGASAASADRACENGGQLKSVKPAPSGQMLQIADAGAGAVGGGREAVFLGGPPTGQELSATSKQNLSTEGDESATAPKGAGKKHVIAKHESQTTAISGMAVTIAAASASTSIAGSVMVVHAASLPALAGFPPPTAVQSASKKDAVITVTTGAPIVLAKAEVRQGSVQASTTQKPSADGGSGVTMPDAHGAQNNDQVNAKTVASSPASAPPQGVSQTLKSSLKLQAADSVTPPAHSTPLEGTIANVSTATATLQTSMVVTQRTAQGSPTAAVSSSHIGGGDLSGAFGAQTSAMSDSHRTLEATPTVLEVGIPNGTQGWLKVRAELTGGSVNASLSAASPAGREMLHRELPALTSYLQQEKVTVNSLVVQAPAAGSFRGLSGGSGGFSGGQAQQQGQRNSGRDNFASAGGNPLADMNMQPVDELPEAVQYPSAGGWLSIRA